MIRHGVRFRTRVLVALLAGAILPLLALALGLRREMDRRLSAQYRVRAAALVAVIGDELAHERATIGDRIASLCDALRDDNRFRLAAVQGSLTDRAYLLDYAAHAMRLTGLSMLQIQDEQGRILSSGHFRNEFDRLEPDLPILLAAAPGGTALVDARTPDGPLGVLARVDSVQLAGRRFVVVGGITVDDRFLRELAPDSEFAVGIRSGGPSPSDDTLHRRGLAAPGAMVPAGAADASTVGVVPVLRIAPETGTGQAMTRSLQSAQFVITHSDAELDALRRSVDAWFAGALAISIVAAFGGATWLAAQVSRPLSRLSEQTRHLDLDRLDVAFATDRSDEVGELSRLLDTMMRRLRASAGRLRDAERRATVGDLARQVTHDVKNGLVPIHHVLRHLVQVERDDPERLGAVFSDRRPTLDASVGYLDALAQTYARLARPIERRPCDLALIAREVAASAALDDRVVIRVEIGPGAPIVLADALVVRRILDNLVSNAIDAVASATGTVTVRTMASDRGGWSVAVSDDGPGMTDEERAHAFDDFYTTKPGGTGLGLSIVRRLAADLGASLRVETTPGKGTTMIVEFEGMQPVAAIERPGSPP